MNRVRVRAVFQWVVPFLLATPIIIFPWGNTGIVLADGVALVGLVMLLRFVQTLEAILFLVSFMTSLIFCYVVSIWNGYDLLYGFGSLIFFFKPCLGYFAAMGVERDRQSVHPFFNRFCGFSLLVLISVVVTVIFFHGGIVRGESVINGSVFGFPIFGSYGVNTLAVFFAFCAFFCLVPLTSQRDFHKKILFFLGFLGFSLLVLLSLSREAVLGLIVMLFIFLWRRLKGGVYFYSISVAFFFFCVFFVASFSESEIFKSKFEQIEVGLESGDLDYLSSGRLTLYTLAIQEIIDSPVYGTAFQGSRQKQVSTESGGLDVMSPHNQYLTALWKMGLLASFFYFMYVLLVALKARKVSSALDKDWLFCFLIGVFLVFCNLWDVLYVPNLGLIFFYVIGCYSAVARGENEI